jgi:hypothetical protein
MRSSRRPLPSNINYPAHVIQAPDDGWMHALALNQITHRIISSDGKTVPLAVEAVDQVEEDLWQAGFINTTCAFGVHLTDIQFAQLSDRRDRKVFIAFDPDPAGAHAARTVAQRLQQAALIVRIVDLPSGQDPNRCFVDGASAADFDRRFRDALSP